jgi:hypothetical protein
VYGQSRSAAVIVAYLLSLGVSIQSAIDLLKEKRQVICINPGFLAQLFLLSAKGFQAPEVQLILQNPLRFDSTKLSNAGNAAEKQNLAKLLSSDNVDSYKIVSGGKKRLLCGTCVKDDPDSGSDSWVGERLPDSDLSLCADTTSEGKVKSDCSVTDEELICAQCGFVLAKEANIIRATLYADFLMEHTDSYWAGYRPIHPPHEGVIALESAQLIDKKRVRPNNETKLRGRSDGPSSAQKCVNISVVGPMEWITEQIESRRKGMERQAPLRPTVGGGTCKHAPASEGGADAIKLTCPSCRNTCGYCVAGGLEACQSFLRCDLLALTSPIIKRSQQVRSNLAAQLHDPGV